MNAAIEIYTRPGCGYCSAAKSLLTRKKVAFTEHDAISVYGLDGGMWSKLALPPKTLTSRSANGRRTSKVAAEGTIHQKETFEVGKRTDGAENRTSSAGSPAHERPCSTNMTDRRLNLAVHLA